MNNEILKDRWKYADQKLNKHIRTYDNLTLNMQDELQLVFDNIKWNFQDANKPISKTQKTLLDRYVNLWKKEHPQFSESLNKGKEEPDDQVERSLFERATGYVNKDAVKIFMPANAEEPVYAPYEEHVAPDVTAQIFWLKNRRPDRWRDRQEHTGLNGGPIETYAMTPEERKARLAELEAEQLHDSK